MSYISIPNLYQDQTVLLLKECYALEKIHGTKAHVRWVDGSVGFFVSDGKHEDFVALFDREALTGLFKQLGHNRVVVYGEAYGGKMQGMRETYGPHLRFVVFDVKIDGNWLSVPQAEDVAHKLGLDYVPYERGPATVQWLDMQMGLPSVQAIRNGIDSERLREGIVIRPLAEVTLNNGERVIAKYKAEAFQETRTPRRVIDPEKQKVLEDAQAIALEWVTFMRLAHVLEAFSDVGIERTGDVVKAMIADVEKESKGEVVMSRETRKAIGSKAAVLFKQRFQAALRS